MRVSSFLFGVISLALLASCSSKASLENVKLKTESLSIVKLDSNGEHQGDVEIADKQEIDRIFSYITTSEAPEFKCGQDYELHCFDENEKLLLLIELNSEDLCKSAVFVYNDRVHHRYLSDEGADYFKKVLN